MSYYDPWFHVLQLVFNRVLLFLATSLTLSGVLWCWLLQRYFDTAAWPALRSAWDIGHGAAPPYWTVVLALTVSTGTLATAVVFAALLGLGRLRQGEQHRRGARVVDADERSA